MSDYVYPYIADKNMFKAVMGACSWIRQDGYFNKAVNYYANKYDVDRDELASEIRKRQAAGQRYKKPAVGRKYKYYIVATTTGTDADPPPRITEIRVQKATSDKNACTDWTDWNRKMDYGGNYAPFRDDYVIAEYETQSKADNALEKLFSRAEEYEETHGELSVSDLTSLLRDELREWEYEDRSCRC